MKSLCCKQQSKTEELINLRSEVQRLNKLVDQLMHNDYKGKTFCALFDDITELLNPTYLNDNIYKLFDASYYSGLITITFDRKFVHFQKQTDQMDYIQRSIYKAFHGKMDNYALIFSFEHHKDGVLHAHMLIQSKNNNKMSYTDIVNYRYELALYFTDRIDNKKTVRLDDVNVTRINSQTQNTGNLGVIDYIIKEGFKVYKKNT